MYTCITKVAYVMKFILVSIREGKGREGDAKALQCHVAFDYRGRNFSADNAEPRISRCPPVCLSKSHWSTWTHRILHACVVDIYTIRICNPVAIALQCTIALSPSTVLLSLGSTGK